MVLPCMTRILTCIFFLFRLVYCHRRHSATTSFSALFSYKRSQTLVFTNFTLASINTPYFTNVFSIHWVLYVAFPLRNTRFFSRDKPPCSHYEVHQILLTFLLGWSAQYDLNNHINIVLIVCCISSTFIMISHYKMYKISNHIWQDPIFTRVHRGAWMNTMFLLCFGDVHVRTLYYCHVVCHTSSNFA